MREREPGEVNMLLIAWSISQSIAITVIGHSLSSSALLHLIGGIFCGITCALRKSWPGPLLHLQLSGRRAAAGH